MSRLAASICPIALFGLEYINSMVAVWLECSNDVP